MAAFRPQIVAAITRNLRGGRCERIRTSDPFLPKEVRYQAAPHTEERTISNPKIACTDFGELSKYPPTAQYLG